MYMFTIHDCSKTILAKDYMLTMDTWKSHLNNNICLVGASGRGKTRNFIMPNIMQMNSNFVISDPKGTLVLKLGDMLEAHGYKVKVLNLLDMEKSNSYNPFKYITCAADVYKLIDYLIANVNPNGLKSIDPFWDNASKALLSAICFYLYYECRAEDRTFGNVMKLLRCLEVRENHEDYESTLDVMFSTLKELDPEHIAVKQYQVFKSAAGKTAKSIQISTEVWLQHFNLDEYDALTSTDDIDLESIGKEKTALFVIVSDTDRSKNWLAGIFYCQLFDVLCNYADTKTPDHRLPIHVRFILDDFACTAKIPDFDYKLAMIRSREISCIVAIQDEAQLEKEYWKAAQGVISNCDTYIFLGSTNIDSCNIAARRLGNPEITGTDIRCMDYGECVVICGNEGGIYEKFDLKSHPRYSMIADKSSSEYYALAQKHRLEIKKRKVKSCAKGNTVLLKERLFDSKEEEYLYAIDASFKERLVQVTLYPCCPEIAAKYDLTNYSNDWLPYYQELRVIMDKWLLEQLGEPRLQNEHGTEYKIGNILIGTDSYVDERARDYRVVGGSILSKMKAGVLFLSSHILNLYTNFYLKIHHFSLK